MPLLLLCTLCLYCVGCLTGGGVMVNLVPTSTVTPPSDIFFSLRNWVPRTKVTNLLDIALKSHF